MKKSNIRYLLPILLIPITAAFSESERNGIKDYGEMMHTLEKAPKEVKKLGTIELPCLSCVKVVEVDKRLLLKKSREDLGVISFDKEDVPVVLHFVRTKDSPTEVQLLFKNGHTECSKSYTENNPVVNNGDALMGCLMTKTVYEEQKIQLNLKNWPAPLETEEQIIEVKITKGVISLPEYRIDAEIVKGDASQHYQINLDKKFWGQGFNLNFSKREGKR